MAERLNVRRDGNWIYDIVVESSYERLGEEIPALDTGKRKICIVTDSNVAPLYLEEVKEQISKCCKKVETFIFPAGEKNKNLDTVRTLYEFLIQKHFDRKDVLVALGGGVVGDLCGFAGATYLRGIRFIQVPTTLLSQVDSSIGGKTGVDFDSYKNMVGAFHMPSLVYASTSSLLTLSAEQFASGMGEIVKHGLIKNRDYYQWICEHADAIRERDLKVCEQLILVSCQIKRDVVEKDPTEQGERALLNFGHTLGHAIEKLMNFKLAHGQCVALGCLAAAHISAKRGMITDAEVDQMRKAFATFDLPVSTSGYGLDPKEVIQATKNDKKMEAGAIKFVLLRQVGEAYIGRTVTEAEMEEALEWLAGGTHER